MQKGIKKELYRLHPQMMKQLKKYISIRGYVETDALFITLDRKPVIEIRNIREEGG